jgi:hypothetical protein
LSKEKLENKGKLQGKEEFFGYPLKRKKADADF